MAEGNGDKKMPNVQDDLRSCKSDKKENEARTRAWIDLSRKVIAKIAAQHFGDENAVKERERLCICVDNIIKAYENKVIEIDGLNNLIQGLKKGSKYKDKEIWKLKQLINQLRAQLNSVCETCKKVTTEIGSLSIQESGMQSSMGSEADEVDGQPIENQEIEENGSDPASDEEFGVLLEMGQELCPHAGCGFVAFLRLFNTMNINFCPLKFIQKYGMVADHKVPSCTQILSDLEKRDKMKFIERVHHCDIEKGNHNEKYSEIAAKFIGTKQQAGILWYSRVDNTKHCVTVHVTHILGEPQMEIEDAQLSQDFIADIPSVRKFVLFILITDPSTGISKIEKQWSSSCHADICKEELRRISEASANNSLR